MSEIGNLMYGDSKKAIILLVFVGVVLLLPGLIYEYSIGFIHVKGLGNLNMGSLAVGLVFLSGFVFGIATLLWILMRMLGKVF